MDGRDRGGGGGGLLLKTMHEHVHSCLRVKLLGNGFWYYVYQYLNMDICVLVHSEFVHLFVLFHTCSLNCPPPHSLLPVPSHIHMCIHVHTQCLYM